MYVHNTYTQNLYLHLDREQPSMKYMIRPFMFVQCTYMLHTNFDIDVICFQLGNGQFQLLMQFCNLFYIRTTTYFLRLLLFSKTHNRKRNVVCTIHITYWTTQTIGVEQISGVPEKSKWKTPCTHFVWLE